MNYTYLNFKCKFSLLIHICTFNMIHNYIIYIYLKNKNHLYNYVEKTIRHSHNVMFNGTSKGVINNKFTVTVAQMKNGDRSQYLISRN